MQLHNNKAFFAPLDQLTSLSSLPRKSAAIDNQECARFAEIVWRASKLSKTSTLRYLIVAFFDMPGSYKFLNLESNQSINDVMMMDLLPYLEIF